MSAVSIALSAVGALTIVGLASYFFYDKNQKDRLEQEIEMAKRKKQAFEEYEILRGFNGGSKNSVIKKRTTRNTRNTRTTRTTRNTRTTKKRT